MQFPTIEIIEILFKIKYILLLTYFGFFRIFYYTIANFGTHISLKIDVCWSVSLLHWSSSSSKFWFLQGMY